MLRVYSPIRKDKGMKKWIIKKKNQYDYCPLRSNEIITTSDLFWSIIHTVDVFAENNIFIQRMTST